MTLIEGIGDEVTQFFLGLLVILIVSVCVAWWTTSISEQRHVQTVWLLDRRRHRAHRRLTNHTHTVTIAEGTATATLQTDSPTLVAETATKPPEASTSSSDASTTEERTEDDERSRIVQAMDEDACVLRQRRIAFYNRSGNDVSQYSEASDSYTSGHVDEDATRVDSDTQQGSSEQNKDVKNGSDITIKLKYINDDLKLVDGKLKEQLGDFKKRHFQGELSSNKLVRLIFNGQVLQQDSKTLEGCGFFDNCVVHCLIHQRRPTSGEESTSETRGEQSQSNHSHNRNTNTNNNNNNNNQGRDWDLGNFLFAIISFTLLSAWYFRYVYAHLYTVTATVGLILMTGVFTIVLFGFYFPDQEHLPQRMETPQGTQS